MIELRHLGGLDYLVVGVYMLIVVGVGLYVARFNRQTSDYFKGGGRIPWFLSGLSLFISGFSAFMFVSAAGFAYRNGMAALALFPLAGVAYLFGYYIYGVRWRRSRIDTPMEFLTRRYSPGTTYFYTLLAIIPNVLVLGIYIYTLCIFVSTALGFNDLTFDLGVATVNGFQLTMLVTGGVLVFYTVLGGLWAVIVTDALQFVIVALVTLIILPAAYIFLGDGSIIGGVQRLVQEAPEGYFGFSIEESPTIFYAAYFINIVLGYNVNWHIAQRYYSVPDERDTKKMALLCAALSFLAPLLWMAPVLATKVLFPDLAGMWPALAEPSEAAFVTLAMAVLPHGMLGIMVAAMFAATMSSADTTFNWLGAVVTKDLYVPISRRLRGHLPSERTQLAVGKVSVLVMGLVAIWVALSMEKYGGAFDVYLKISSLYHAPMFIPVMLGLVFTRTPWWSGMATLAAGTMAVLVASLWSNLAAGLPVDSLGALLLDVQVAPLGIEMGRYEINTIAGVVAGTACFAVTALMPKRVGSYARRILRFERDLRTPAHEPGAKLDLRGLQAYRLTGWITIGLGGLLLLIMLATLGSPGSLLNLAAATMAVVFGALIIRWTRRYRRRVKAPEPEAETPVTVE